MQPGAFPEHVFKKVIEEQLLVSVKNEEQNNSGYFIY
jgi:hypothetical protein